VRSPAAVVEALREELCQAARALVAAGLTRGTSGNLSARIPNEPALLISRTGAPLSELQSDDLVRVELDGRVAAGQRLPSSEWQMHRDLYAARPAAGGIVHAHPPHATTLACLRRALPAVHYEIAIAGGPDVRCADYATFGTEALSQNALSALAGRKACLLANHGLLAVGATTAEALRIATTVETVAELYLRAVAVGEPAILDDEEMARVLVKFESYGKG
jgi:L-fuculose-phosphate aldolase